MWDANLEGFSRYRAPGKWENVPRNVIQRTLHCTSMDVNSCMVSCTEKRNTVIPLDSLHAIALMGSRVGVTVGSALSNAAAARSNIGPPITVPMVISRARFFRTATVVEGLDFRCSCAKNRRPLWSCNVTWSPDTANFRHLSARWAVRFGGGQCNINELWGDLFGRIPRVSSCGELKVARVDFL